MLWISPSWLGFLSSFVFHTVHFVWLQHKHHSLMQRSQLSEFITIMSQWLGVNLLGSSLQRLWSLQPSLACSASQMSNPHKRPLSAYSRPTTLHVKTPQSTEFGGRSADRPAALLDVYWATEKTFSLEAERLMMTWYSRAYRQYAQTATCWRKMFTNHISKLAYYYSYS